MARELVIATRNQKKLKEIKELLSGLRLKIYGLRDFPGAPYIREDGKTYKENAAKKAVRIAKFTQRLTLGEDSGIEIDALGRQPGVRSSRFSGKDKNDLKNNLKVMELLKCVPYKKRTAHYYAGVALADENGLIAVTGGKCSGIIGFALRGSRGFGYDPLFIIPKHKKTFGQLGEKVKHKISHRAAAIGKAKKIIAKALRCP